MSEAICMTKLHGDLEHLQMGQMSRRYPMYKFGGLLALPQGVHFISATLSLTGGNIIDILHSYLYPERQFRLLSEWTYIVWLDKHIG